MTTTKIRRKSRPSFCLRGKGGMSLDFVVDMGTWTRSPDQQGEICVQASAPDLDLWSDFRPVTGADVSAIGDWCNSVVATEYPELTVPALTLPRPGIVLDVLASEPGSVTVEFRMPAESWEEDGCSFDTTLMALRHTAVQVAAGGVERKDLDEPVCLTMEPDRYRSFIWRAVDLPSGSRLNGVGVSADEQLGVPGNIAVLWLLDLDPDCDAELELDRLRICTGAVATINGTYPDGDQFGILLLQSTPALDDTWLTEWGGSEPIGVAGVPGPGVSEWLRRLRDPESLREAADRLQHFYGHAFSEALAENVEDAVFAKVVGWHWVSHSIVAGHLVGQYSNWDLSEAFDSSDPPLPLRETLRRLLGEAVGIPLDRMLTADRCVLPGIDHTCRHEPVPDALSAWMDRLVSPEQFTEYAIATWQGAPTTAQTGASHPSYAGRRKPTPPALSEPVPRPGPTFSGRFRSVLGAGSRANPALNQLYAAASEADAAGDDSGQLAALKSALDEAERLLIHGDLPSDIAERVHDLAEQLGDIFGEFPPGTAEDGPGME